ncbi:hypothetical protein DFH07DRAFT_734473 [Mycena maculata]|uniref:BTB domain-containing protein n=1 Tax=Mycena maculata TaxID=230809 RepID=A0AAD7NRF7_9AGAR|nr:hypothetical protein DFH07DRAFT_734473 [Mycena maculata]
MSSPPSQQTEGIARSSIWYDDGSVVLQAENTQFRLHWGVLAQHSSFFRDIKGLPQPPDQPTVEGCPVVELQDATGDVEYLLKALYSPTFLAESALPFWAVAALIRLGRKYDFREVLDKTVERVTFENPATLEQYDACRSREGVYATRRIVPHPGILYDMLTMARENNLLSVLPCAYLRATMTGSEAVWFHGIPRGDGTTALLEPIDLQKCVSGRHNLLQHQWNHGNTLEWLKTSQYDDCTNPQWCGTWRHGRLGEIATAGLLGAFWLPSLWANAVGLCERCRHRAQESMASGRKKMWDELPSFFTLPAWSELKNDL